MKKLRLLSLALVLSLAVTVMAACTNTTTTEEETDTTTSEEVTEQKVEVVINNGEEERTYELEFEDGLTAYDYLTKAAEKDGLELKTTEYDFGISIDAIGEEVGETDGKYWMYYVDGQSAPVAVDKQEIGAGSSVEFKFESSEF